jgi:hypothetical protein
MIVPVDLHYMHISVVGKVNVQPMSLSAFESGRCVGLVVCLRVCCWQWCFCRQRCCGWNGRRCECWVEDGVNVGLTRFASWRPVSLWAWAGSEKGIPIQEISPMLMMKIVMIQGAMAVRRQPMPEAGPFGQMGLKHQRESVP